MTTCRVSTQRRGSLATTALCSAGLLAAPALHAALFGPAPLGGRATGQNAALVARADDPSAVFLNPAGLSAASSGFALLLGADQTTTDVDFDTYPGAPFEVRERDSEGTTDPLLFSTWKKNPEARFSFGLGIAPFARVDRRLGSNSPLRFGVQSESIDLDELRIAAARRLGERWSVGVALRWIEGDLDRDTAIFLTVPLSAAIEGEALHTARASVDGWGVDLGARFAAERWGVGFALRSGVDLGEQARTRARLIFITSRIPGSDPAQTRASGQSMVDSIAALPIEQRFDLPPELAAGAWFAPAQHLELELDALWRAWSHARSTIPRLSNFDLAMGTYVAERDWRDVLELHLGLEADLGGAWTLGAGLGWAPSPIRADAEPTFPVGDAVVYSIGLGRRFGGVSADLGLTWRDEDDARSTTPPATFSHDEMGLALSLRFQ